MKIAIIGAGAAAFALAVLLKRDGHDPLVWSPSGKSATELLKGRPIVATGIIEGEFSVPAVMACEDAVRDAQAVIFALPAMGHRMAMDRVAPHLVQGQRVVISSHASFGALYLDKLLAERGMTLPIVAWSTTLLRSRQPDLASCRIATLRKKVDMAVLPVELSEAGLGVCRDLFGDRFNLRSDLLAVALSNVNPQGHMALSLCNFTRMELGEVWDQNAHSTPAVERLSDAVDAERIALANAFGVSVRTAREHSLQTHGAGSAPSANKVATFGPATIQTRYTLEDVPYGLVPAVQLGRLTGALVPLHEAGIQVFSALYGRDMAAENDLLGSIISGTPDSFHALCRHGFRRSA